MLRKLLIYGVCYLIMSHQSFATQSDCYILDSGRQYCIITSVYDPQHKEIIDEEGVLIDDVVGYIIQYES